MVAKTVVLVALALGCAVAQPTQFWKDTPLDGLVEEARSGCSDGDDSLACIKYKVMSLLDTIFKKDTFQLSDSVEVTKNGAGRSSDARSNGDLFDSVENFIQSHDVTFNLPAGAKVMVSPRNLDKDELSLNINFSDNEEGRSMEEARKSKIKKIIMPIMVFVLLKAMTLIPLAIGVLGLKAWNALQLSFFSFVVSVALAIFQLCKKIAADNSHPQIAAHGPWDAAYAATYRHKRDTQPQPAAQDIAYNAYH